MVTVLQWLAFFVPVAGIGAGCVWLFWQHTAAALGEQVRTLEPPAGVALSPVARHAIFEELYRRRRAGCRAAVGGYAICIAACHPMYAPDRLSDAAGGAAFGLAVLSGFAAGETYAATRSAHKSRPPRRMTTLSPREPSTYLSDAQRISQFALLPALAAGCIALTVGVVTTDGPVWSTVAAVACWSWLVLAVALLLAQRSVLAQPPTLTDEDDVLVREYVTATAVQQLHRGLWLVGLLAYTVSAGFLLGPAPRLTYLLATYLPVVAVMVAAQRLPKLLHRPDPVWHFARVSGSPV